MIRYNPVPKIHPNTREATPDDPLGLHAVEVPGDPGLMLRLLVEEYARMGWGVDAIMRLADDPNYQAFHGLLRLFGAEGLRRRINAIVVRCGVLRVRAVEAPPPAEETESLLQIEPAPTSKYRHSDLTEVSRH